MDITGTIIAVLPAKEGTSKTTGNPWKMQEYVLETQDRYPRKCVFGVFGEDKISMMNIQPGEVVTVFLDIDAHEYNGRWYNSVNAWKVERPEAQQAAQPAAPATAAAPAASRMDEGPSYLQQTAAPEPAKDDLPF